MCSKNQDHMMYGSWYMKCNRQNFCHLGPFFALRGVPLAAQKMKISKQWEKHLDIIILHQCTKNYDHMLYCSWDIACVGYNCYFSFWATFCTFTPLTVQKMKISKKRKNLLEISSFYTSTKNHDHMLYCTWDYAPDRSNYFSFWAIFCNFTPLTVQKIKT